MIIRATALLAALALTASACGSDGSTDSSGGASSGTTTVATATTGTASSGPTTTERPAADSVTADVERLAQLRIFHPETLGFAAPFTMLETTGGLVEIADEVSVETWTSPDVLRSILVNGESEVTAVPSYVGANLFNRGVDVHLAAVVVWGLLWLVGPDGTPADWESLRGKTVMVPFPNDLPDLVFQYLAAANGLKPGVDFTVEYYAQPPEVVGRLVSGQGKFAVLPEHVATVALAQAGKNGHAIGRVFDLQAEWATATGLEPRIPQAGIVVSKAIAGNPTALARVLNALDESVAVVNAASPQTVARLSETSGVPEAIVADVIPRLNLDVVAAADARKDLETFYTELASLSPDIIGGELPSTDFYLTDPR